MFCLIQDFEASLRGPTEPSGFPEVFVVQRGKKWPPFLFYLDFFAEKMVPS